MKRPKTSEFLIDLDESRSSNVTSESAPSQIDPDDIPEEVRELYPQLSEYEKDLIVEFAHFADNFKITSLGRADAFVNFYDVVFQKGGLPNQWSLDEVYRAMERITEHVIYAKNYRGVADFRKNAVHKTRNRKDSKS